MQKSFKASTTGVNLFGCQAVQSLSSALKKICIKIVSKDEMLLLKSVAKRCLESHLTPALLN